MKTCKHCDKELVKWQKKYCSQSCASTVNGSKYPKRKRTRNLDTRCAMCGVTPIARNATKFCSCHCMQAFRVKQKVDKWLSGELNGTRKCGGLSKTLRDYLVNETGGICPECGWSKINLVSGVVPLQVDHIDGNPQNNCRENLRVLCPCCHSLTSTYGALKRDK